ncbi:MAG: hypothetical protein IKX47_01055 [Oscillospiraceae bacterium]|nr:hypothetical protein [Oscillospiraceae bacterium]
MTRRLVVLLGCLTALLSLAGVLLHLCMGGFSLWWLAQMGLCLLVGAAALILGIGDRVPREYILWACIPVVLALLRAAYLLWMEVGLLLWLRRG